jgi:hypothetical protein
MPGAARFGRPSKPLAVAAGVVILLILVWIVVPSRRDYESFYPSLADAAKDEVMSHGWLEDEFLPPSSRSIHVAFDLSPSTEWCAFDFAPADSQNLRKNLRSVDVLPPYIRRVQNPHVSWWPGMLRGNLDREHIHREGFELYVVERPANSVMTDVLLFAIDWSKGRGFFYSAYKSED